MRRMNAVIVSLVIAGASTLGAVALDLTTAGSYGTINGAFFTTTDYQSAGSGAIDSFVRLNSNDPVIDGYNADARPVMPDVNNSGTFTHDIQLSHVPIVVNPLNAPAGSYYEFLLDINQNTSAPLLSLDQLRIYTYGSPLTVANTLASLTGTPVYSLDLGADNEILLNYNLNPGSGAADMLAYIPVSAFSGIPASDYVYLYSMFGSKGGAYINNDGFEEWAVRAAPLNVPDGGTTAILLGFGLGALSLLRRKLNV